MARHASQILADIDSFKPLNGNWLGLEKLLEELFLGKSASVGIETMLRVFERYPTEDGNGVFWSIVHGMESLPGYEVKLVESVQRSPSQFSVLMVGRILNSKCKEAEGVRLLSLLKQVVKDEVVSAEIRQDAREIVERFDR